MRDVVFMVRNGRSYEELRYALRSIAANLPHRRVWVYGGEPRWLAGATHIPVRQGPSTHTNTARITAAIAANRMLSPEFYWFHDDMYVLTPTEVIPRLWRATWADWSAGAKERRDPHGTAKTSATAEVMARFDVEPVHSYELHVPMVIERDALRRMVEAVTAWRPEALVQVQKRSLYGNWVGYGGERAPDVKFYSTTPADGVWSSSFASSNDLSLASAAGERVRAAFAEPCRYERLRPEPGSAQRLMAGHLAGGGAW
jgi:hypothetical protein